MNLYSQPEIRQAIPEVFTPTVVCIGPLHRPHVSGEKFLLQMVELKRKYVKAFQNKTTKKVEDLALKREEWENKIRSSYTVTLDYDSKNLIEIVLVDACFIIDLFLRCHSFTDWEENDPIFRRYLLCHNVYYDLLRLENQLLFFVLEDIYNFSGMNLTFPSFLSLSFNYFEGFNKQEIVPEGRYHPKHFTDLVRTFMIPTSFNIGKLAVEALQQVNSVYTVSQLKEAGLEFKVSEEKEKSMLDLEFKEKEGVLTVPCLYIRHSTEVVLRNILAFEQCHLGFQEPHYISQYLQIMDFLINNEKDVDILIDKKINNSLMGDKNDMVKLVNSLCKNVGLSFMCEKYFKMCTALNSFYKIPWNNYCKTPNYMI